jgi:hypothetical protein
LPGAWTILEQDFATHPPTYIVDVQPDPKSAQNPVKNFPILAKLLAERYQPVAHTAEGEIYRMREVWSADQLTFSFKRTKRSVRRADISKIIAFQTQQV